MGVKLGIYVGGSGGSSIGLAQVGAKLGTYTGSTGSPTQVGATVVSSVGPAQL